jgi:acetoin utilization protein AcuB
MLVRDYMTRHPIMVDASLRVVEAQRLMVENRIRHLPVVADGKRLIGMVTLSRLAIPPERLTSLDVWEITRYLSNLTVGKVMISGPDLVTIGPDAVLEDAADLLIKRKVSGLPVVEGDVVQGILTDTDLLIELRNMLGAVEPGWRITVRVPNEEGELSRLVRTIGDHGWGVMAMGTARSARVADHWDVVLKVQGCASDDLSSVVAALEGQEVLDVRETSEPEPVLERLGTVE